MNYGEIKHNIISLGFAEESDYEEFEELGYTYDSINRAIRQLEDYFPAKASFDFDIDETDTGILRIDMSDVDGFLGFVDSPIMYESEGEEVWRTFTEFEIEMDRILVIKADDYKGSFRVYYNKLCTQLTPETPNDFVPELPLAAHHLIPLLASYYLWMDDDERKAFEYRNDFEEKLAITLQKTNKTRATVKPNKWGDI